MSMLIRIGRSPTVLNRLRFEVPKARDAPRETGSPTGSGTPKRRIRCDRIISATQLRASICKRGQCLRKNGKSRDQLDGPSHGKDLRMRFLGKDPESQQNGSPTIWDDGDSYVIQGWRVEDPKTWPSSAPSLTMRPWSASPSG